MYVAQVFDAVGADGRPYFSPETPRLVHPELRSLVIGYLATAPLARPGHRTDGVWVWPESLARNVRERGVGPQAELLRHLAAQRYLLPGDLSLAQLAAAAAVVPAAEMAQVAAAGGPTTATDTGRAPTTYYAGYHDPQPLPSLLLRRTRQPDGGLHESIFTASGWEPRELATTGVVRVRFEEVSRRRAADLVDELCSRWYERMRELAAETRATETGLRLARVFDDPSGSARFSPSRLRVVEPERRERLAAYLSAGRLVVRAAGRVPDPFDPQRGRVISLNYRTDGTWVWQEALSYYVRTRGVAPELDLLCHIEERAFAPAAAVADDVATQAVAVVKAPPPRLPDREPMAYYGSYRDGRPRRLVRVPSGDPLLAEELGSDLRWWPSLLGPAADASNLTEVDETEAIRVLDLWCELQFAELTGR